MRGLFRGRDEGVSAVEFGLVLPIFLILLLGIMDYGYIFFVQMNMTNAAREGVRVGVTRDTTAQAQADAVTTTNNYLQAAGINATVTPSFTDPTLQIAITISPFNPLIGFVPTPNSLNASAAMRWELAEP